MYSTKIIDRVKSLKNINNLTIPTITPYNHTIDPAVPITDIVCGNNLQRLLNAGEVKAIARKFDWKFFGTVTLVKLPCGTLVCSDGQQRTAAAYIVGHSTVPAVIINGSSKDAGLTFIEMNEAFKRVPATSIFLADRETGDVEAKKLSKLAQSYGYTIDEKSIPGVPTITAITGYKQLIRKCDKGDPDYFYTNNVLNIMSKVWPKEDPLASIMRSIGLFLWVWDQHFFKEDGTTKRGIDLISFFKQISRDPENGGYSQAIILDKLKGDSSGETAPFRQFILYSKEYNQFRRDARRQGLLNEDHIKNMILLKKDMQWAAGR